MMNLQSQAEIVQRKIIATKAQSEAETAINDFAMQLYSSYIQTAIIKESFDSKLRYRPNTADLEQNMFEFFIQNINGTKLCTSRSRNATDVNICIKLPEDFAKIQKNYFLDPDREFRQQSLFSRFIMNAFLVEKAQAQRVQTASFAPNPNAVLPALGVNRLTTAFPTDEPEFVAQYEQLNCEPTGLKLGCVKIKICLKFAGCASDQEKIRQTYVFLRVPQTQLRD